MSKDLGLEKKIDVLIDDLKVGIEKKEAKFMIRGLVNRIKFPDNYCPECDSQMFFDNHKFVCECGYEKEDKSVVESLPPKIIEKENNVEAPKFESKQDIPKPTPQEIQAREQRKQSILNALNNPSKANVQGTGVKPVSGQGTAQQPATGDNELIPGATSKVVNWVK